MTVQELILKGKELWEHADYGHLPEQKLEAQTWYEDVVAYIEGLALPKREKARLLRECVKASNYVIKTVYSPSMLIYVRPLTEEMDMEVETFQKKISLMIEILEKLDYEKKV
ncbi:MAG: hypothetical protein WC292_02955 [Clostridia bacterium]